MVNGPPAFPTYAPTSVPFYLFKHFIALTGASILPPLSTPLLALAFYHFAYFGRRDRPVIRPRRRHLAISRKTGEREREGADTTKNRHVFLTPVRYKGAILHIKR